MTNLSITPSKLEIQLKPGSKFVQSYIAKNNGDKTIILNTSIDSWIPSGSNGAVTYLNSLPNIDFSLSNTDLKLEQSFLLEPNQSKQLVLKIQVPNNFTNGDQYLTFFVNQDTSPDPSTNSTQLIKLGSHLLISVSDSETTTPKFSINNFKTKIPFIDCLFSSIKFSGEIQNDSDYYSQIDNSISITKNDNIVSKLTIFPDNVLAHHNRSIRCISNNNPHECQLQGPLWPGVYQATVSSKTISFVVLPYSIFVFAIIIIIIIKILVDIIKPHKL